MNTRGSPTARCAGAEELLRVRRCSGANLFDGAARSTPCSLSVSGLLTSLRHWECLFRNDERRWGRARILSLPTPTSFAVPRAHLSQQLCKQKQIVTWLILPVVICLSQRLSHACLSISTLYSETANGSLNQSSCTRQLRYYTDTCGNSRANTCVCGGNPAGIYWIKDQHSLGESQ